MREKDFPLETEKSPSQAERPPAPAPGWLRRGLEVGYGAGRREEP